MAVNAGLSGNGHPAAACPTVAASAVKGKRARQRSRVRDHASRPHPGRRQAGPAGAAAPRRIRTNAVRCIGCEAVVVCGSAERHRPARTGCGRPSGEPHRVSRIMYRVRCIECIRQWRASGAPEGRGRVVGAVRTLPRSESGGARVGAAQPAGGLAERPVRAAGPPERSTCVGVRSSSERRRHRGARSPCRLVPLTGCRAGECVARWMKGFVPPER